MKTKNLVLLGLALIFLGLVFAFSEVAEAGKPDNPGNQCQGASCDDVPGHECEQGQHTGNPHCDDGGDEDDDDGDDDDGSDDDGGGSGNNPGGGGNNIASANEEIITGSPLVEPQLIVISNWSTFEYQGPVYWTFDGKIVMFQGRTVWTQVEYRDREVCGSDQVVYNQPLTRFVTGITIEDIPNEDLDAYLARWSAYSADGMLLNGWYDINGEWACLLGEEFDGATEFRP